jgi:TonB family protein
MNRLQKKCLIATAGFHLLLLVILFVGPAFFNSKPKVDDSQVLDVIPANLIDAAFNSGVKGAQPPPPTPIVTPPQPTPTPPAPKQIVQPAPVPQPTFVQKVVKYFTPEPKPDLTPIEKPEKNPPHQIQPSLTPVVRNVQKNSTTAKSKDNSQTARNLAAELKSKLSTATQIDMPGDSSVAYANYASAVKSVYDAAWTLPDSVANDDENVKVSVTIASDGTVISSRILTPSGDAGVDSSVQRTLDRVMFIAPFPDGATDKQRTYTINFNPQLKRLSE